MTPLHLSILIHYYIHPSDYEGIVDNKVITDYAFDLASRGLLYSGHPDGKPTPLFKITAYGKKLFENYLQVLDDIS